MKKIKSMWNFVKNKFYKNGITAIAKEDWWQIVPVVCFFIYSIYFYANNLLISDLSDDLYFRVRNFLIFSNILIFGLYFCKKQTKKLIWGVQIQSFKTTIFSLTFSLFLTLFLTIFYNLFERNEVLKCENLSLIVENLRNFDQCTKDYAEGATQLMIAIGTSLMAIAIFVFEYITKKDRYFDKYFILGLTNIINLLLIFFLGLILLIFHYLEVAFVSDFIKNFINIYIFTLILTILSVVRIYKTAICLLYREDAIKIENEIVNEYADYFFNKIKNVVTYEGSKDHEFYLFLEDFFGDTLSKVQNMETQKIKDDWKVICKFYEIIINEIYEGKINYFDIVKLSQFLQKYLHYIPINLDVISYRDLIYEPNKIFRIFIDKKYFLGKSTQNYFYYFNQLYEKGFDLKNSEKELSRDEKNIANILIDRSWRYPKELAKYNLEPNYKKNKDSDFFKGYAKEILIYYRDLLKTCFDNNDSESFKEVSKQARKLFGCDHYDTPIDDEAYKEIQQYKLLNFYGLASWILEKTDEESIEKNSQFLSNVCYWIEDILSKDVYSWESKFNKFIKLFSSLKEFNTLNHGNDMYILGLEKYIFSEYPEEELVFETPTFHYIRNFFIYFCLEKINKEGYNIFDVNKLSLELAKVVGGSQNNYIFTEVLQSLESLESLGNNKIFKLLKKQNIQNIDELVIALKKSVLLIRDSMIQDRKIEILQAPIDKKKIEKFKGEIRNSYLKSFGFKNILKNLDLYKIKNTENKIEYGIRLVLEKEPFIEKNNVHLSGNDVFGTKMIQGENNELLKKLISENSQLKEKIIITNLNEFEKILKLYEEDAVVILLNISEYCLEQELKKRTFYKQNFIAPKLGNNSEILSKGAVGIYKFKEQKIPVYQLYSEAKSGVLVINKKKFGKLIQFDINELSESENSCENTFNREFYLEVIDCENDPKDDFKKLRDNPPDSLKSKGDKESQENYLKQIVILKFFQSFEFEPAENFEAYLIEMNPYF